jgi:hypothetical protein
MCQSCLLLLLLAVVICLLAAYIQHGCSSRLPSLLLLLLRARTTR